MIVKREYAVGNVHDIYERLLLEEGIKRQRFFRNGRGFILSTKMTEFRSHIDYNAPLLYIAPLPIHSAPFVLQSDRIIVKAENETKGDELIYSVISKHAI